MADEKQRKPGTFDPERARAAAQKSAEVRRAKREQRADAERILQAVKSGDLSLREEAIERLRQAMRGGTDAAAVQAAKAALDLEQDNGTDLAVEAEQLTEAQLLERIAECDRLLATA